MLVKLVWIGLEQAVPELVDTEQTKLAWTGLEQAEPV